ncbi:hypothetical protein HK102_007154, partial [Quaeritorhiza haematococci]
MDLTQSQSTTPNSQEEEEYSQPLFCESLPASPPSALLDLHLLTNTTPSSPITSVPSASMSRALANSPPPEFCLSHTPLACFDSVLYEQGDLLATTAPSELSPSELDLPHLVATPACVADMLYEQADHFAFTAPPPACLNLEDMLCEDDDPSASTEPSPECLEDMLYEYEQDDYRYTFA